MVFRTVGQRPTSKCGKSDIWRARLLARRAEITNTPEEGDHGWPGYQPSKCGESDIWRARLPARRVEITITPEEGDHGWPEANPPDVVIHFAPRILIAGRLGITNTPEEGDHGWPGDQRPNLVIATYGGRVSWRAALKSRTHPRKTITVGHETNRPNVVKATYGGRVSGAPC